MTQFITPGAPLPTAEMGSMRAAITPKYGPASVLELRQVPSPRLGPSDVLIQVHASPVTAGDLRLRAADFPSITGVLGRLILGVRGPKKAIQGTMFAGRVVAVGTAVTRFTPGDDVFGSSGDGAYAEYVALAETGALAKMPNCLSYEQAAAIPYGAVTAMRFLRDIAGVRPGDEVLVIGASGGVGRFAVQVAKHLGANVTGVCSRNAFELVHSLGADQVIDRQLDFTRSGRRWDVIFDTAGATTFLRCRSALTSRGRYTSLLISVPLLLAVAATSLGAGRKAKFAIVMPKPEDLDEVRALVERRIIRPATSRLFPLERIVEAHATAERARTFGTVIVTPNYAASAQSLGVLDLEERRGDDEVFGRP